jgi:hypothetical protein
MDLIEREFSFEPPPRRVDWMSYFCKQVDARLAPGEKPIRFVITKSDEVQVRCEVGVCTALASQSESCLPNLFDFRLRSFANAREFNSVLLVPTGIGAAIGGDAGDASPALRMLASVCDRVVTHPNVVNASDINELPENGLYVEGSVLTRLMMGTVALQRVRSNRILALVETHEHPYFTDSAVNSVSAARATLGVECSVLTITPPHIKANYSSSGRAIGSVFRFDDLLKILHERRHEYDAVAMSSVIDLPVDLQLRYFAEEIVNPWGGVEALLSHAISLIHNVPSAHAPMMSHRAILEAELSVVAPTKAAEAISLTFFHCVLKGLHRSPRIITDRRAFANPDLLKVEDISCLVVPDGCLGLPTLAAAYQGIPVIVVRENTNRMKNDLTRLPFAQGQLLFAENYLEAVGLMAALKAGVSPETTRRPLSHTALARSN